MKSGFWRGVGLALMAMVIGMGMAGCAGIARVGNEAYLISSNAVADYCSMSVAQRTALQLVVSGKAYNSGICDVVNGNKTLTQTVASTVQAKVVAEVDKALDEGRIDQATAANITGAVDAEVDGLTTVEEAPPLTSSEPVKAKTGG